MEAEPCSIAFIQWMSRCISRISQLMFQDLS